MNDNILFTGTVGRDQFFLSRSVTYLPRSRQLVSLSPRFHYGRSSYYRNYRKEFDELTSLYGESVRTCRIINSSLRDLGETLGLGLFAEESLSPGDFIGEYSGIIGYASRCRPVRDDKGGFATDYAWTYPERKGFRALEVNGRDWGNEMRFINHSFDPNCRMEHTLIDGIWVLFFIADRQIRKGEQLTADYGEEYWTGGFRELLII